MNGGQSQPQTPGTELSRLVGTLIREGTLTAATLSSPRAADPAVPRKITLDTVEQKGGRRFRARRHYPTRTTDEMLTPEAAVGFLLTAIGPTYRQAILQTPTGDRQVLAGGRGAPRILELPPSGPPGGETATTDTADTAVTAAHNRTKRRLLPEGRPVDFLVALGVQTAEGRVKAQRHDKFRQVNRFLELVDDVLPALPEGRLTIVDFGSGKSYLTFALHHLLTVVNGREADILGLDLKEGVVAECQALVERLGLEGLRFEVGDIASHDLAGADLVVSLHACDTATDAALHRAVTGGAPVILAVPCCQHELSRQLSSAALAPLLRHGTLRERFASEVTDAARARLLELVGYRVQVIDFVPLEHTPKNVLLRAVRTSRPAGDTERLAREYRVFADALGIDPALERLLRDRLPAAATAAA
ncbi:MAG: class I SAM-dependent methyltransferase [Gaiella sp.]